ncbi:MAG: DUF4394 domain-containing protein [Ilumatobacteraceae bacterium]
MRRTSILSTLAVAVAVGTTAACVPPTGPGPAPGNPATDCATRARSGGALSVVGLVADGTLACFSAGAPGQVTIVGTITGLDQDASIVGMDYRPANDTLYAVGNAGGVYTVDAGTATVSLVSRLNQPLQGSAFGVDFNPTVDRLRIVSDAGQNLRANVDDGTTTVDGVLNIPGTPPVSPAVGVTAVAYTNNDADPSTATTLFDIDTANDNTVIQAPANAGSLSPTGKLGVDAAGAVGFDIYRDQRDGVTVGHDALASVAIADGTTALYRIDLLTGRASNVGAFSQAVVDIAIPTAQH